jgi:hypothetical protein
VQKILSRQLIAVNISELINNGGLDVLINFVREAFKTSWNGKNLSAIKDLDRITKELTIPSRSGSKIVDSLSVSYFIYTDTSYSLIIVINNNIKLYIVINLSKRSNFFIKLCIIL